MRKAEGFSNGHCEKEASEAAFVFPAALTSKQPAKQVMEREARACE